MRFVLSLRIGLTALAVMAYSCGGQQVLTNTAASSPPLVKKEASPGERYLDHPAYIRGLALINENDCANCHTQNSSMIGPSYSEIALKYDNTAATISTLATRVISGSVGVWGDIPMTPHPSLSQEKAEQMIKYIFLLKDQSIL